MTRAFPRLAGVELGLAYSLLTVFAVRAFLFVLKALTATKDRAMRW